MIAPLSVQDLFTPTPSGVGPNGVPLVPGTDTWFGIMLGLAATVQLPTTSWQSGAPERSILAIEAVTFAQQDVAVSIVAQGGFLQSAAGGSAVYVPPTGTPITIRVTPDPSNPAENPTGAPGWLDLLTSSTYDVDRIQATAATGPLAIANTTPSTKGPYAPGTYHVGNGNTGATYANPATLSIPTSIIPGTGGTVVGFTSGLAFSIVQTQTAHGLSVGEVVYLVFPPGSGVSLVRPFGTVTSVTATAFSVSIGSSGTWVSGGTVYDCTIANMQADVAGPSGNAAPGSVNVAVTQNAGVFIDNVSPWAGANFESNQALVNRTVLSMASRSPNGPGQAYVYFAETAVQLLAAATPPYTLTNGPVLANESSNPITGIVTTVVASTSPASIVLGEPVTPGVSQLDITGITNANPAVVSCAAPTTLQPGQSMTVTMTGVLGVSGVSGTFLGTYVTATSFSIPVDTTAAGTYAGGGQVEGGDLGQIDRLIQLKAVPDNTTAITESALAMPITIIATVVLPAAFVAIYQDRVGLQLEAQLRATSIGGSLDSNPPNSVAWDDILAALEEAGVLVLGQPSVVRAVQSLFISGNAQTAVASGQGIFFPSNRYQALLAPPTVNTVAV